MICCLNDVEKKKGQTSEQTFVNAVTKIWMPEMNSMIHSKTSFECSRQRMGPKMQKWLKEPRKLLDIVKVRDSWVLDTERIYKGSYWQC